MVELQERQSHSPMLLLRFPPPLLLVEQHAFFHYSITMKTQNTIKIHPYQQKRNHPTRIANEGLPLPYG